MKRFLQFTTAALCAVFVALSMQAADVDAKRQARVSGTPALHARLESGKSHKGLQPTEFMKREMFPKMRRSSSDITRPQTLRLSGSLPMKSLASEAASARAAKASRTAEPATAMNGLLYWAQGLPDIGLYSFDLTSQPEGLVPLCLFGAVADPYVGTMAGNKYLVFDIMEMFGSRYYYWYVYDLSEVDLTPGSEVEDLNAEYFEAEEYNQVAFCADYDPTTSLIYGIFLNDEGGHFQIGTLDPVTFNRVGTLLDDPDENIMAVDFDENGILYAITAEGVLGTIDKQTGAFNRIGDTGVPSDQLSDIAVDSATGDIYYTPITTDGKSWMYRLNPYTAEATLVYQMPYDARLLGNYIPTAGPSGGTPSVPTDVTATFEDASLEGSITFRAPETNIDGTAGEGSLTYNIMANGQNIATGSVGYGETKTVPVTLTASGKYTFLVWVVNDEGQSERSVVEHFVGEDMPQPPVGVKLEYADGKMTLTWSGAEVSANGGYFDPAKVTFTVTPYVGDVAGTPVSGITECTYTEDVAIPESYTLFKYTVAAVYNGVETDANPSNSVGLGDFTLPYSCSFSDVNSLDVYTIIDANKDETTWTRNSLGGTPVVSCMYNTSMQMDDWLILPSFKFTAGRIYTISFGAANNGDSYPEKIEIKAGAEPTAEAMTITVMEPTEIRSNQVLSTMTCTFLPETTGKYYIGFHGISEPNMYYLHVSNITIDAGVSDAAPGAPEITVKASETGALTAEITVVAPTKTIGGADLASIDRIEVCRGDVLVHTFTSCTPGQSYTCTDTEAQAGTCKYTATAYNADGTGFSASASDFVGYTYPQNVESVTLDEPEPGKARLRWTAVTADLNGRPLAATDVRYTVATVDEYGSSTVVEDDIEGCEYTCTPVAEGQAFIYYAVYAKTAAGPSLKSTYSNMESIGTPYTMPYYDTFADATLTHAYMTEKLVGSASWRGFNDAKLEISDADGNNGFIGCVATSLDDSARIITGKIAVTGESPMLTFYLFGLGAKNGNKMEVAVISGGETKTLGTSVANWDGWKKIAYPLDEYVGKTVQISFTATAVTHVHNLIDAVRVAPQLEYDIAVRTIAAPEKVAANTPFNVTVGLENLGTAKAENYTVELYAGDELASSVTGEALEADARGSVVISHEFNVMSDKATEFHAKVVFAADQDLENNESPTRVVALDEPKMPVVSDLAAVSGETDVTLSWSEPVVEAGADVVTDDFESYESFALEAGDWTMVDADGVPSGNIMGGLTVPTITPNVTTLAYYVLDFANQGSSMTAHSGTKCLANNYIAPATKPNSDWLISPVLSGNAQTITFYAKSFSQWSPESMRVLYSTEGTDINTFIELKSEPNVPAEWTEYSIDLPEGAIHFAIECNSSDKYFLMLDDFTYAPGKFKGVVVGYNVYRDGVKLNDAPVEATTYVDAAPAKENHSYGVTTVYDLGESPVSNIVEAGPYSGIGAIDGDNAPVEYYNLQGIRVSNPKGGIFIRRQGRTSTKVLR